MNRMLFTVLLLLSCLTGRPQQLFFSSYTISDGLSQSVVNCIFHDSRGFVWIGTQNGLNRFDGYTFEVHLYRPDDTTSISNNWIYGITEDNKGDLWVATKGGLNKYIRRENRFERIRYHVPLSDRINEYIYDVESSQNGRILINTPPLLSICDPLNMTFQHIISPLPYDGSVKDCNIPLLEAQNGNIWMGSTRGLACYDPATDSFRTYTSDSLIPGSLSDNHITALLQDREGTIWVGTTRGLNLFREEQQDFISVFQDSDAFSSLSNQFIRAILEDAFGYIWVATEGNGLIRIHTDAPGNMQCDHFPAGNNSLNHDIILSLASDRSNNLWIGTLAGINKTDLKKQKFRLYRKSDDTHSVDLSGNVIASLFKDDRDVIWVGTWGQGLNLYNRRNGETAHFSSSLSGLHYLPNDYIHTIFEDAAGRMWLGTRDGLLNYNEQTGGFVRPHVSASSAGLPELRGLRIFMMTQERDGAYWIATQDGLFHKKDAASPEVRFHAAAEPPYRISSNLVYAVMEDSRGLIWIGTSEGLDLFDPAASDMKHFKKSDAGGNSLSDNFITTLFEDHQGRIWIGTSSYVNMYDPEEERFTYFAKEQGLPGNLIYSILEDHNKCLWVATGNGLCRFDPYSRSFHAYSIEDGLQSAEFNLGAAFVSKDGEVFFGGMNGFNSFYPDSLLNNPHLPGLEFTSAYKIKNGHRENIDLEKGKSVVLKHNDHSLTIAFSALEFTNPSRNQYSYRLEGMDDNWIDIGNRNFIPFTNLAQGEYLLRVKGSNNDGLWDEEGDSLLIIVRPPWWKSSPALMLYALLFAIMIFFFFKRREQKHIRDKKILEDKVKERTLQIEEQKEQIMLKNESLRALNQSKDTFFSIIAHDLRNPFHSILGLTDILLADLQSVNREKLQNALENIRGSTQQAYELLENLLLWSRSQTGSLLFKPEALDMNEMLDDCLSLLRAQATRKNINIHVAGAPDVIIHADPNMIRTIMRNLLTNALKFSFQDGEIFVSLMQDNTYCTFSVKDNGTGMSAEKMESLFQTGIPHKTKGTAKEPGTGLGLMLCREFVLKHKGKLEVSSESGKGSEFRMVLPIKQA